VTHPDTWFFPVRPMYKKLGRVRHLNCKRPNPNTTRFERLFLNTRSLICQPRPLQTCIIRNSILLRPRSTSHFFYNFSQIQKLHPDKTIFAGIVHRQQRIDFFLIYFRLRPINISKENSLKERFVFITKPSS
jgi:hypothetical protein